MFSVGLCLVLSLLFTYYQLQCFMLQGGLTGIILSVTATSRLKWYERREVKEREVKVMSDSVVLRTDLFCVVITTSAHNRHSDLFIDTATETANMR